MLTESVSQLPFLILNIIFYSGALNVIVFSEFRLQCSSRLFSNSNIPAITKNTQKQILHGHCTSN